ncbi:hypothetical protein [Streptomyces sp. NPDC051211]|uniref:hypothetical protein n=1 Tax=Streptomyces sp. NPDC051211 TaxID=3154643 RepID=UPI00344F186E
MPMHAEWDTAHTDHTTTPRRPEPRQLAATSAQWDDRLKHTTPHGWLLAGNSTTAALTSGRPVYLLHTTNGIDAIKASGQLHASTGCLMAAVYCAPLTPLAAGLRPHNLARYLLEAKRHTETLVFEVTPDRPMPPKGIDYLRLGPIHLRTFTTYQHLLTEEELALLQNAVRARVRASASFLATTLSIATGGPGPSAADFVDQLAAAVPGLGLLGYLYFEVLSEYLMLNSTSDETCRLADLAEMNNHLYKRLAFAAVADMGRLFDLAKFAPDQATLARLLGRVDPTLDPAAVTTYVRGRLPHLFTSVFLAPDQDPTALTLSELDYVDLAATAPGLVGQLVFRELRTMSRYPQLYACFEQAKALEAWAYWGRERISVPFNGCMPKGELGLNPAYPGLRCRIWTAETSADGLVHPTAELDVTPTPRIVDLNLTAMRRDEHGRPAGHPGSTQAPAGTWAG